MIAIFTGKFVFDLQRFKDINNYSNDTLLSGTSDDDYIYNGSYDLPGGDYVTIQAGAGNDYIYNNKEYGETSGGCWTSIDGGAGADYIVNDGESVTADGGLGNDTISNNAYFASIDGGAGNDSILAINYGKISISGGTGDDKIRLECTSDSLTINGGKGSDTIYGETYNTAYVLYQYAKGDGNDIIHAFKGKDNDNDFTRAFKGTDTLTISGGSYSTIESGNDVLVKVGNGTITLKNVYATADKININNKSIALNRKNIKLTNSSDSVAVFRDSISVAGSTDNDTIKNFGYYVTINGGTGNDEIENEGSFVTINTGEGNDSVDNWYGSSVTINTGAGNDDVLNVGSSVTIINTGAGNDSVENYGDNVTINTGKGNDSISNNWNFDKDAPYDNNDGSNVLFKYSSGDGNDIIYGFKADSTLSIGGGSYSTKKSGDDIIVTVGNGKISLMGAATLDAVNIKFKKTSTETNSWKLSGTTATYGTSKKTLVTVKGVKSTSGLSVKNKIVTVSKSALGTSKVTVSDGYTLALAKDVTKTSTKKAWSLSGTTATYKQTTAAGYSLAKNSKSISYTKKATKTLATVNGAKSKSGFTLDDDTITLKTSSLSKKVSVSGGYAFEFASDYKSAKITGSSSADTIKTAGANMTITGGKGNDSIVSKGKNSVITGGKGKDTLTGSSDADIFVYSNGDGNDVITNFDESDKISLKSGTAKISTSGDDVVFTVGDGKITLKKASGKTINYFDADGNEKVYPETKSDIEYNSDGTAATLKIKYSKKKFEPSDYSTYKDMLVTIDAAAVKHTLKITGNEQANEIIGTGEDDTIYGGAGGDIVFGGAGNDKLYGEKGNDKIYGGDGEDSLWGGKGSDTLTGGDGADIFLYDKGDGNDVITDYSPNIDKVMILSAVMVDNPTNDSSGNVTFKLGTGQITFQNSADKYIELVDTVGNVLKKYNPR